MSQSFSGTDTGIFVFLEMKNWNSETLRNFQIIVDKQLTGVGIQIEQTPNSMMIWGLVWVWWSQSTIDSHHCDDQGIANIGWREGSIQFVVEPTLCWTSSGFFSPTPSHKAAVRFCLAWGAQWPVHLWTHGRNIKPSSFLMKVSGRLKVVRMLCCLSTLAVPQPFPQGAATHVS